MKICIFGAGAVGGHLAARLAASGNDVSVVARGAQLAAMRAKGLVLLAGEQRIAGQVRASDRPADLGLQDIVLATLKATSLGALAEGVAPLLGPDTAVVFVQNGIPWWYAQGLASSHPRPPDLARLDPGGVLARAISPDRLIGGVVYSANTVIEPGVIRNSTPQRNRLLLGNPDDASSARLDALRAALTGAGIEAPLVPDIRKEVWYKLLLNLGSGVALLAEQPGNVVMGDPAVAAVSRRLLREGQAIAAAHGIAVDVPEPSTLAHKPSILQDFELGRPMEIEALLMATQAFARAAGLDTPVLDTVSALSVMRSVAKGLYTR